MSTASLAERRARIMGPHDLLFYDTPIELVRGEGAWLFDQHGRRYLDCYNNVPCVGHSHPQVVEALHRQAATLNTHTRYLNETMVSYCERMLSKFDDAFDRIALTCTGSEANDLALRLARHFTGGDGILCTQGTYHGNTTAVSQLTSFYTPVGGVSPAIERIAFPDSYRYPEGLSADQLGAHYLDDIQRAISALRERGVKLAAMLVCPIYANEGLPQVPSGYFESAAELVRREGGLLIADEVQSGFGRTGHWWGYQQYAVVPDIITLGKPMGAGHPLAGLVTRREVMDPFRAREMYFNTFGGNPVSCAVGDAVLDVLEAESLVDNAAIQGQYITERLRHLINHHASVGDIRNNGLFVGVDIVSDRREHSPDIQTAAQIVNQMRHEGILISKAGALNNVLKIRPPLCFDRAQADQLCDTLASVMANI